jgi:hypothetical protein
MARKFRYYMKLFDGRLVYGVGESIKEAAAAAGVIPNEIKRCMPVEALQTEAELEASRQRIARMLEKKQEEANDE